MENRNNLEKFYSDFMECSSKNIVSTFESQETSLNPSKSRYDLQLLLSLYDKNGTIIQGNKENAVVKFENDSRGKSLEVNVPLESLEFVDSWIFESFPELKRRKNLGVYGLLIDSFVSLSIKFLRISILKLLDSLVSLKKTPDIEPMDSYTTCSISSNILDLTVNDLLSFLKLVSHDFYSNVDVHKKILRVLYAFNSSELLDLLIDDTVLLLRFESQQVIDYQTEHPYWRRLNVKECVEFPAAREIAFEFDFRTSLKQGQAVVIFSKDEAGKEELLVLSGSFGNCVPSSVFGFMPVIVPGNCVWIHFVCCDSKTDPSDFGLFFRARPISYDYKDERDIFQAPLGWLCFKYLLSKRKTLDDQMMIVEQTLESRKFPSLFSSLLRYILCKSSPRKAFVTNIICEFLYLIGSKKLDESVKSKILSSVEVLFLFQKLQELLDYLREGEMGKTAYIYGYSSFYQSLCSMFSILRQVYPRFGYLSISFFPKENDVSKTSVFDIKVSFGKNYNLDLARVEICLCRLLSSNLIPSSELIDMAYERLSVENSYRACLKELETNIKISKQSPGWKDLRKRWVSICNSFHGPSQGRELLSLLKSSISDSAFVFEWVV